MIDKLKDNLASVAALIAATSAIGGGFVKYGEISTRLSQIGVLHKVTSRCIRYCY